MDGEHSYIDIVFYDRLLRCSVLIDLKMDKLTHQDLEEMQMYANYFDRYQREEHEAPTVAIVLCSDKNDAVVKKFPHNDPTEILDDLVASTPWEAGKWLAAAKSAGLYDEALAHRTPRSPQTLVRAARDFGEKNPSLAVEAGVATLLWLLEGYGFEITGLDILSSCSFTMEAAKNTGCAAETLQRIRTPVSGETFDEHFVPRILGQQMELSR